MPDCKRNSNETTRHVLVCGGTVYAQRAPPGMVSSLQDSDSQTHAYSMFGILWTMHSAELSYDYRNGIYLK